MLFIKFDIEKVDYEKSVENLLPVFVEKCKKTGGSSILEKLIARLDDKVIPVSLKLLDNFDEATRNAVLVNLVTDHRERLTDTLNHYLETVLPGNVIHIGGLTIGLDGSKLVLWASEAAINYPELFKSELVKRNAERLAGEAANRLGGGNKILEGTIRTTLRVLGMGAKVAPEEIEELSVLILRSETVQTALMPVLVQALQKRGFAVEAMLMTFRQQPEKMDCASSWNSLEEPVLDALAAWLISTAG